LLLGYSRQSFYQAKKHLQHQAYEADLIIAEVLKYRVLQKHLGTRKLFSEMQFFLTQHMFSIGRDALFNLLRDNELLVRRRKRKGSITTFSKHRYRKYPNIIKEFIPNAPNQLWVSDITYIHVGTGFAYLSLITDVYSHKILGFNLHKTLEAKGPLQAFQMAMNSTKNVSELIHHSDRGVQYCCDEYVKLLKDNHIKISMTENGDPLENAVAERVNGILKTELLEIAYPNYSKAQYAIAVAISTYNYLRPHNSINNLKPVEAHLLKGEIPKKWKSYYKPKIIEDTLKLQKVY
jgi:putative transposase